ncbi:MAG: glycosyltransferase [Chromatiaceae bacterium]
MILIPARDEANAIAKVISDARRLYQAPIVVIDDGSQDDTTAIASTAGGPGVPIAPASRGLGAMLTGFCYAYRQGWDLANTLDSDGQHDPAEILGPDNAPAHPFMIVILCNHKL